MMLMSLKKKAMSGSEPIEEAFIIEGYLRDASNTNGFATHLFRPSSAGEIASILQWCQAKGLPVTVSGGRTSTTGAATPHGGAILSMERFDQIHGIDEVDANVMLGAYQSFLRQEGRSFPPDPTSKHECTIGGAIACNASGARSFHFGSIRQWVEAVEVVFPNGDIRVVDRQTPYPKAWPRIQWSEPAVKTAAGYSSSNNLLDLLIGQEGTLGVITKAWLKTIAAFDVVGVVTLFASREVCLSCVAKIRNASKQAGVTVYSVEYFDRFSASYMREKISDFPEANCGLIIEVNEVSLTTLVDILERSHAMMDETMMADNCTGQQRVQQARHAIPAGINEQLVRTGMPKVGTDFAVPFEYLSWMMDAYDEVDIPKVLFGHIGDAHLHLNMLPRNATELERARMMYAELARIAISYGGTVSAEHGIGKSKRAFSQRWLVHL